MILTFVSKLKPGKQGRAGARFIFGDSLSFFALKYNSLKNNLSKNTCRQFNNLQDKKTDYSSEIYLSTFPWFQFRAHRNNFK